MKNRQRKMWGTKLDNSVKQVLKCFSWPSKVFENYSSPNSLRLREFEPQKLPVEKATRLRDEQWLEIKSPAPRIVTENRRKHGFFQVYRALFRQRWSKANTEHMGETENKYQHAKFKWNYINNWKQ